MAKKENDNFKEILDRLQDTFKQAELNVAKAFKDLGERLVDTQQEAKKRVDDVLATLKKKDLAEPVEDALAKVAAVREDFEERFGHSTELLWEKLGLASKADIADLTKKLAQLTKRLAALEGKKPVRARSEA